MAQKVLHKRSSVLINGNPKLPSPEQMEYGEIAINFAAGHETLSILNNSGSVETFSSDKITDEKIENLSGNVLSYIDTNIVGVYRFKGSVNEYSDLSNIQDKENGDVYNVISGNSDTPPGTNYAWDEDGNEWDALGGSIDMSYYATYEDVQSFSASILTEIEANEYTTALALTDLDSRIIELSGETPSGLTEHISNSAIHVTQLEKTTWNNKQDSINDLSTIRNNAISGSTAYVELSAHTANTQMHLPPVTSTNNNEVLTVVNGQWSGKTPSFIYVGTSSPESSIGQDGDIYALLGLPGEVLYYNSVSGVLTSSTYNITFSKALDDFDYVLCYFRGSQNTISDTMAIPPAVLRISLNSDSTMSGGEFCGSVSVPYINNHNRYAAYSCIINPQKTQFRIEYQQSLYGTAATDLSDASHGIYCYRIVGYKDNALNNLNS